MEGLTPWRGLHCQPSLPAQVFAPVGRTCVYCVYVCACVCMCVCMCVYVCVYVCMYVCVSVCCVLIVCCHVIVT